MIYFECDAYPLYVDKPDSILSLSSFMCILQIDIDFRLHYPGAVGNFLTDFTTFTIAVIATARLSRKDDMVQLLPEYDSQRHSASELSLRDHLYALLALIYLLPNAKAKVSSASAKAKVSSAELLNSFIWFKPQQTSIELFLSEKASSAQAAIFVVSWHHRKPWCLLFNC
jgi:hypothetical protein